MKTLHNLPRFLSNLRFTKFFEKLDFKIEFLSNWIKWNTKRKRLLSKTLDFSSLISETVFICKCIWKRNIFCLYVMVTVILKSFNSSNFWKFPKHVRITVFQKTECDYQCGHFFRIFKIPWRSWNFPNAQQFL